MPQLFLRESFKLTKDNLFKNEVPTSSFSFNKEVAEVFDDMANRSIINYQEVTKLTTKAACYFAQNNSSLYDLGCATGNTLLSIAEKIDKDTQLIGYDYSEDMIKKCKQKLNFFSYGDRVFVQQSDCLNALLENASVVIMNYTLQFINEDKRKALLEKIYLNLKKNGAFILSEKVNEDEDEFTHFCLNQYYKIKEQNGYSKLEIAHKRNALEKVLVPNTYLGNYQLLKSAGFKKVMTLFKNLNFTTYLAIK